MIKSGDYEVKKIVTDIIQISRRNHDLIGELTDILNKSYRDLKAELEDTMEMSKIGGYKTVKNPSSVYFDKTG